jgi:hypothetical protein
MDIKIGQIWRANDSSLDRLVTGLGHGTVAYSVRGLRSPVAHWFTAGSCAVDTFAAIGHVVYDPEDT